MTYGEAVKKINSLLRFGIKPGLERIKTLLNHIDNPQNNLRFVHVAGTNGKGSTCAMIASVLKEAGYRTGMFISPFVTEFRERIQINGQLIPESDLCELLDIIMPHVVSMADEGLEITEFELITAIALKWFSDNNCDVVVFEVGLGGRFDATNIIDSPLASVITSISFDHTNILGDTIEKIAFEKSGIIKDNRITVVSPNQNSLAMSVILKQATAKHNKLVISNKKDIMQVSSSIYGTEVVYKSTNIRLPLIGEHQVDNLATSLSVVQELIGLGYIISIDDIKRGIEKVEFPARLEIVYNNPLIILDGAHNPDGVKTLSNAIKKYMNGKSMVAIIGMLADKDAKNALLNIAGMFSSIVTVTPNNPRAMDCIELSSILKDMCDNVVCADNVDDAINIALSVNTDAIIIFGSLYLAGQIRPKLLSISTKRQK